MENEPISNKLITIDSEAELLSFLQLNKSIIYIKVDWSGQERISRNIFYKVLNEIETKGITIFQIDLSSQNIYAENWLLNQENNNSNFKHAGFGEIVFVQSSQIIDFIKFPGEFGFENTKEKIMNWLTKDNL